MPSRSLTLMLGALLVAAVTALAAVASAGGERAGVARGARAAATAWARDASVGLVSARGTRTRRGEGTYAGASTVAGKGRATARARVGPVNLFDGLVRADSVRVAAAARGGARSADGRVESLMLAGDSYGSPSSADSFGIPGGYGRVSVVRGGPDGITGLTVRLTKSYKGNPAGATARIAFAAASASNGSRPSRRGGRGDSGPPARQSEPKRSRGSSDARASSGHDAGPELGGAKRKRAPDVGAKLTGRGYTFPVFGESSYSDEFGAPRGVTSKHEGNDVFADTGTPVVAVTDGTLNRVGTKRISGNRLWLKSKRGDSFFYAHLSAFAHDARNGARVKSGDVLGFVGSTGDAEKTPPHVHFEVHPNDGKAVNPYPFLRAWEENRDVPAAAWLARYGADPSSRPGALVVLEDYLAR